MDRRKTKTKIISTNNKIEEKASFPSMKNESEKITLESITKETLPTNSFERNLDFDESLEDEIEYKFIQRNIFLINSCQVCKSHKSAEGGTLKKCNNCKMISYCNKEHQVEHWNYHKDLCKAIRKVCKNNSINYLYEKTKGLTPEEFKYFRITMINKTSQELKRNLELWEKEMFYYPEVCIICFESNRNLLEVCIGCNQVFLCKNDHLKENHKKWCNDMKQYRDLIIFQEKNGILQPELNTHHKNIEIVNKKIKEVLVTLMNPRALIKLNALVFSVVTDNASCPLTVKFAIEKLNMNNIKELTIHVVGAETFFELDNISKWENFLAHVLDATEIIKIIFIGPELVLSNVLKNFLKLIKMCDRCLKMNKKILFEYHENKCYHEYVKSSKYTKPDIICAFNAGMYRVTGFNGEDTWGLSIQEMIKSKVPLLITEYTSMELNYDLKRIQNSIPINIIIPPSQNPFASLKPSLNFVSEEEIPLIYKNYFYMIVIDK